MVAPAAAIRQAFQSLGGVRVVDPQGDRVDDHAGQLDLRQHALEVEIAVRIGAVAEHDQGAPVWTARERRDGIGDPVVEPGGTPCPQALGGVAEQARVV